MKKCVIQINQKKKTSDKQTGDETTKVKTYIYLDTTKVNIDKDCNLKKARFSQGLYLGGSAANCEDEMNEAGCLSSISLNQYGECHGNTQSDKLNREGLSDNYFLKAVTK